MKKHLKNQTVLSNTRKLRLLKVLLMFQFVAMFISTYSQSISNSPIVHDPVMIKENNTYYLFCTGWGISMFSSADRVNWKPEKPVFEKAPEWTKEKVTDFKGYIWAPDIFLNNGTYYLYYSVSSFAKNTSCIGLATNSTLNVNSVNYKWVDRGMIVQSVPGCDMWNAIDPNIIADEKGDFWMTFGSFWNGIKMVKLNSNLTSIALEPEEWYTLSSRQRSFNLQDTNPGDGAVEAPFIFKKSEYYYLFVSFDYCCRGKESDYKIMVGRSKDVKGPYLDKEEIRMDQGGGSLVLEGNPKWAGLGHNSAYNFDGKDYLVYHAYDNLDNGKPKLQIQELHWDITQCQHRK